MNIFTHQNLLFQSDYKIRKKTFKVIALLTEKPVSILHEEYVINSKRMLLLNTTIKIIHTRRKL